MPAARRLKCLTAALSVLISGCTSVAVRPDSPVPLESEVDLERFMGDWYVIAHIPTFLDKTAHNATESYRLDEDNSIATTYRYRKDGFDGDVKEMTPTAHVTPGTGNALWGMRFVPLISAEYRISYLDPDYSVTVVGRTDLDYVWLMARRPEMDEQEYQRFVDMFASWGYDTSKLVRVPHRWPDPDIPVPLPTHD